VICINAVCRLLGYRLARLF